MTIKEQAELSKINIIKKSTLETLNLTEHPNEIFGITDESEYAVDSELNANSENPVQNRVLYNPVVFAEAERQKSKNLLVYPYTGKIASSDITIAENGDGSFTINGQKTLTDTNSVYFLYTFNNWTDKISPFKLTAGTYTAGLFANVDADIQLVFTEGTQWINVDLNKQTTITVAEDTYFEIYLQVPKHNTAVFNNLVVYPMLVKGTELVEWQPYNGAIVHEKEIADVEHVETIYDMLSSDESINLGYTGGIQPKGTISNLALSKYKTLRIWFANYGQFRYQGFLTLNIEGSGYREIQSTIWDLNYQIAVNKLGDTSSLTNSSGANCIIGRIEGVY